jgi:hypothetical protein
MSKKLIKGVQTAFVADIKAGLKTNELVKKYNFPNVRELYYTVYYLRKTGVLPKRKSKTAKLVKPVVKTAVNKTKDKTAMTSDNQFRTVYFQDFSVQIHKNSNSRLVVDQNNNIYILNK